MPRRDGPLASEILSAKPNAVIASATVIDRRQKLPGSGARARIENESWQSTSWNYFDTVGEFRDSATWVGNLLSKAKLVVTRNGAPVDADSTDADDLIALQAAKHLFGGHDGQSEMFRLFGIHFTVAGESYIVIHEVDGVDQFEVVASTEITNPSGDLWKIDEQEFDQPLVIRLWKPHPQKRRKADAPARAVQGVLAQILGLTQYLDAQLDSRLSSAGILILPTEVTFPTAKTENGTESTTTQATLDTFVAELIQIASMALTDRSSASARVPLVLQVPGEFVDKVQHLTFWSELDKETPALRAEAIRRLALGMDMPPEILTGTGDMNHWSSWQVEESSIKARTEPLLAVITSSLTVGYLRPYLMSEAMGIDVETAAQYSFGADTALMRMRPNRSQEAMELYDRGELSAEALLRENGFDPSDKMETSELQMWIIKKVAQGSSTPQLVQAAIEQLGISLRVQPAGGGDSVTEAPQPRSLEDHPRRELPDAEEAAAVAASAVLDRALERAGNRLKTRMGGRKFSSSAARLYEQVVVQEDELDELLVDAWGGACAAVAGVYRIDADDFEAHLDSYARQVLTRERVYTVNDLARFLDEEIA